MEKGYNDCIGPWRGPLSPAATLLGEMCYKEAVMKHLVFALLLVAFTLAAADVNVTGTWSGTAVITMPDGQDRDSGAFMVFKQEGATLTGTAGPAEDRQVPISKGKVDGSKVSFEVVVEDAKFEFSLVLDNDHLKGGGTGNQAGAELKVKFDLVKK